MENVNEIKASARVSFKQQTLSGDVFYTFEYTEARGICPEEDFKQQKTSLWNAVNEEINNQVVEVKKLYAKK